MLIKNSAIYMVATLLPGLFSLATTAALTRLLDPHEYGLYGLALVVMTLGSSVMFDWLGVSFIRFYQAKREDPRLVANVRRSLRDFGVRS
jgi:O-antigen/teichoic acid export membrane protein